MKKVLILLVIVIVIISSGLLFALNGGGGFLYKSLINHSFKEEKTTTEIISKVLITSDAEQLILIGKEHHYYLRLTNPEVLELIATLPKKTLAKTRLGLELSDDVIEVRRDYTMGPSSFVLSINDSKLDLAPELITSMLDAGFEYGTTKEPDTTSTLFYMVYTNDGNSYSADKIELPSTAVSINQKDVFTVHNYPSPGIRRILLTPLAVVGDIVTSPVQILIFLFMVMTYPVSG